MTCADNGEAITPRLRITSSACGPCAPCDPALAVLARSPTQSERSSWVSNQVPNVTLSSVSAEQESIAVTAPLPCRQAALDRLPARSWPCGKSGRHLHTDRFTSVDRLHRLGVNHANYSTE